MYIETKLINYSFSRWFTGSHQRLLKCLLALFLAFFGGGHGLFHQFGMRSLFTKQWLRQRCFRFSAFHVRHGRSGFRLFNLLNHFGFSFSRRWFIAFLCRFLFNRFLDFNRNFFSSRHRFFNLFLLFGGRFLDILLLFRSRFLDLLFFDGLGKFRRSFNLRSRGSRFLFLNFLRKFLGNCFLDDHYCFRCSQRFSLRFWVLCGSSHRLWFLRHLGSRFIWLWRDWRRNLFRRWALRLVRLFESFLYGILLKLFLLSPRRNWHIIAGFSLHRVLFLSFLLSLLLISSDLVFLFLKLLFSQFDFLLDLSFDFGLYFALCLFFSFSLLLLSLKHLQFLFLEFGTFLLFLNLSLFLFP